MQAVLVDHRHSASLGKQDFLYVYNTGGQSVMPLYVFGKKMSKCNFNPLQSGVFWTYTSTVGFWNMPQLKFSTEIG